MAGLNPGNGYTYEWGLGGVALNILPPIGLPPEHPFKVSVIRDGASFKVRIVPGTINSLVPKLDGTALDANPAPTKSLGGAPGYVYIECKYTSGQIFPVAADLNVKYETTVPADTDTMCHIALAYIDFTGSVPKKTAQYVSTSLWGERLKCGTNTAEYYFSRS